MSYNNMNNNNMNNKDDNPYELSSIWSPPNTSQRSSGGSISSLTAAPGGVSQVANTEFTLSNGPPGGISLHNPFDYESRRASYNDSLWDPISPKLATSNLLGSLNQHAKQQSQQSVSPWSSPQQIHELFVPTSRRHSYAVGENQWLGEFNMQTQQQPVVKTRDEIENYFKEFPNRVPIGKHSDSISEPSQLPKFPGNSLPGVQLALVAFKAGRVDVFTHPESVCPNLKIGDFVLVEADRGTDLGKVMRLDVSLDEARLLKFKQHMEQQSALSLNSAASSPSASGSQPPSLHYPKPLVRFAYQNEINQLVSKRQDEEKARHTCSSKVKSHGLSMKVVDAEYQWDRRKLTFYYVADHRIDFRDLVKELFRIYKTRIWMCAVNYIIVEDSDPLPLPQQQQLPIGLDPSVVPRMFPLSPPSSSGGHDDHTPHNTRLSGILH